MGTDDLETCPSTLEASGGHRSPSPAPAPHNVKLPFGRWVRVAGQAYVSNTQAFASLFQKGFENGQTSGETASPAPRLTRG